MCDALREDSSLSRARASQHQHGTTDVLDRFPLTLVGMNSGSCQN
jgi:hypothetical protein